MKTIVVPLDFSPVTRAVLRQARSLARGLEARLVLINVVRLPNLGEYPGVISESAAIIEAAEQAGRTGLARLARSLREAGVPALTAVAIGTPWFEIVAEAKRCRADYIVIGSHGHNAFYNFVVGSTAAAVIKHAPCPVVVVASPPRPKIRSGR